MARFEVDATLRTKTGKGPSRQARFKGLIPGVLYGLKQENVHLEVHPKEITKLIKKGRGATELIDLKINAKTAVPVLIKDWQATVLRRDLTHIDFLRVDLTKKVVVEVPIHISGKAAGVQEGGIMELILRQVELRCLPTSIPEFIDVDVSPLNIGQSIHIKDVKVPEGVEFITSLDETIVSVVEPAKEEEVVAPVEGAAAEPEVMTKGKEKVEGEGEAAAGKKPEAKKPEAKKDDKK